MARATLYSDSARAIASDAVQVVVDRPPDGRRQTGHGLELRARGVQQPAHVAEVRDQRPAAHGADAGERIQQRRRLARGPARAVTAQREAVGLVAHLLQQLEARRLARQQTGCERPGR